jgi:hypothetical protein
MKLVLGYIIVLLFVGARALGADAPEFEFTGSVDYKISNGTVASTPTASATKLSGSSIEANLGVGYFFSEQAEFLFELEYSQTERQVAEYKSSGSNIIVGTGVLFNLPIINSASKDKSKLKDRRKKMSGSKMSRASWIPYLGFLISQNTVAYSSGETTQSTLDSGDLNSRLILGARYMFMENVAFNWSLRLAYQNKTGEATSGTSSGGTLTKLEVDARLLALSVFL